MALMPKRGEWVEVTRDIGLLKKGNRHQVNSEYQHTDPDGNYTGMFTVDVNGATIVANWQCVYPVATGAPSPPLGFTTTHSKIAYHEIPALWGQAQAAALSAIQPGGEFEGNLMDDVRVIMYTRIICERLK